MAKHLHKRFSTKEVKTLLQQYLDNKKKLPYILEILQITKRRFFHLLQEYKENPDGFSIEYKRKKATRKIPTEVEKNIITELKKEKELIDNEEIPINHYNYSYIKDQLKGKYKQEVSLPTIIKRAKKMGFYKKRKRNKKSHEREVQTEYIGQLVQHDSSYHKFSPYAKCKWYLITSLDDYSRFILYYKFVKKETTWQHILALEYVFLTFGVPFKYYVDSHSIFRFVQGRDSMWRRHYLQTDDVDT